jgi:UDP-GlcNAc:undecaprenyl-phosphate GlcNAc-1-phosphate transferase
MLTTFIVFATALVISAAMTPLARAVALRFNVMIDHPNSRKLHRAPIPRMGGIAIYAAVVGALALVMLLFRSAQAGVWAQILAVITGATSVVIVGMMDDSGWLHPLTKLFVAMPIAGLLLWAGGIRVMAWPWISLFDAASPLYPILSVALTVAWTVVITSAFSILDHMDGLCSGVAATASAFFLVIGAVQGQILVGALAAAMLGANLGFLYWNLNPARIFMGDGGALLIGFMMATIGIKVRFEGLSTMQSWAIPVIILGIPLFDTALVTVSRLRRKLLPLTSPGKDHTAHRLSNLGLGHHRAVLVMTGVSAILGLVALTVPLLSVPQTYLLFGAMTIAGILAICLFERAPFERQGNQDL